MFFDNVTGVTGNVTQICVEEEVCTRSNIVDDLHGPTFIDASQQNAAKAVSTDHRDSLRQVSTGHIVTSPLS